MQRCMWLRKLNILFLATSLFDCESVFVFLVTVYVYFCCSTGRRGRPRLEIPFEQLRYLYEKGYSAKRMAQHFKCSVAAVYKLLYQHGMKMRQRYTNMSEEDLTAIITNLSKQHPNSGTEVCSCYNNTFFPFWRIEVAKDSQISRSIITVGG